MPSTLASSLIVSGYVKLANRHTHAVTVHDPSFMLAEQDARLALVSCGDHNRLCSTYDITSYPSVRVFHGSVEQWDRYSGILDSRHLLDLLGQHTEGELLVVSS